MGQGANVHMKRILSVAAAVLFSLSLLGGIQGCATAEPGDAQTVSFERGDLTATLRGTPQKVTAAAQEALTELGFTDVSSKVTQTEGTATARTAKDKKVAVKVDRQSSSTSRVTIRVGVFGDEQASRDVLSAIMSNL